MNIQIAKCPMCAKIMKIVGKTSDLNRCNEKKFIQLFVKNNIRVPALRNK